MKGTDIFKRTIHTCLVQRAANDELFAESFTRADRDIDSCINYILNEVQKSGCNGFADDEIFEIAGYYYTADNVEIGNPINARIAVNHVVQLSEQEIQEARQDAIQKAQTEAYNKMVQPKTKKKVTLIAKQSADASQLTLF